VIVAAAGSASVRLLSRYDLAFQYQMQCQTDDCTGSDDICQGIPIHASPMVPGQLPPNVTFEGNRTLDGIPVELWSYTEPHLGSAYWLIATNGYNTDKDVTLLELTLVQGVQPYTTSQDWLFEDIIHTPEPLAPDLFVVPDICGVPSLPRPVYEPVSLLCSTSCLARPARLTSSCLLNLRTPLALGHSPRRHVAGYVKDAVTGQAYTNAVVTVNGSE
jgi:hypothetical protein